MIVMPDKGVPKATRRGTGIVFEKIGKRWYLVFIPKGKDKTPIKIPVKHIVSVRPGTVK